MEEVKANNKQVKVDYYRTIYDYFLVNKHPSEITKDYPISKQNLQFYLNKLKRLGLISKISYRTWKLTEKGKDLYFWGQVKIKRNSPSPSLPIQRHSQKKDTVVSFLQSISQDKKKSVPEELSWNSMTTMPHTFKIVWRPHNYRRKIEVKLKDNHTIKKIDFIIPNSNIDSHTKLVSIKNYKPNITIQYGKNHLTAIYSQNIILGHKETFLIESDTIEGIEERIDEKKDNIQDKLDSALYSFSRQFCISLPFKHPVWDRHEDFVKGEEFIDLIPRETIIHDTYFKKVYGKGIEFKNSEKNKMPTAELKNYIKVRAIEKVDKLIADELQDHREMIFDISSTNKTISKNILFLAENINTHIPAIEKLGIEAENIGNATNRLNDIFDSELKRLSSEVIRLGSIFSEKKGNDNKLENIKRRINSLDDISTYSNEISLLDTDEKNELTDWLFIKFG